MERNADLENETVQTTFKFNRETLELMENLKREFGATSKAEILRKALALLEIARKAKATDAKMAVIDKDGTTHHILGV